MDCWILRDSASIIVSARGGSGVRGQVSVSVRPGAAMDVLACSLLVLAATANNASTLRSVESISVQSHKSCSRLATAPCAADYMRQLDATGFYQPNVVPVVYSTVLKQCRDNALDEWRRSTYWFSGVSLSLSLSLSLSVCVSVCLSVCVSLSAQKLKKTFYRPVS